MRRRRRRTMRRKRKRTDDAALPFEKQRGRHQNHVDYQKHVDVAAWNRKSSTNVFVAPIIPAESTSNASTTGKSRPAEAADQRQTWGGQEVGN